MAGLRCAKCRKTLPSSDFNNSEQRKGEERTCRSCAALARNERKREYRARPEVKEAERQRSRAVNPESRANIYYRHRYGITRDEVDAMIEAQGGVCAVCRRPESHVVPKTGKPRRLQIDHDHRTGLPRGMVCQSCNMVLAHVDDSVEHLQAFIAYLDTHSGTSATFAPRA